MEEKNNKKKKVMILVLVLGLVLLTVGTTYAFFTYSRQGVEEHVLTTGSLYFVYDELQDQEGNQISIGNAFPVSDDKGMKQEQPGMFEFEVRAKNQGADINYEIYLTKDENSTLPEKVVDTYLTTTGKKGENNEETLVKPTWDNKWTKDNGVTQYQFLWNSHVPVLEDGQQGKSLYQETIPSTNGEEYSKVFRYRMWLDESANDVNAKGEWIYGGKSFTVRVNVYASNEELPSPTPVGVMQKWTINMGGGGSPLPQTDFHTVDKVLSISNIRFDNKIEIPQEVSQDNQWDISEKKDKSVMAYMISNEGEVCYSNTFEPNEDETIPCNDIVIAANGEIYGNPDSSFAFAGFMNLKTIDFTNFNTNLIKNTSWMFYDCHQLNNVDLSEWDTSSVTDMSYMFVGCSQLTELDVSSWDTSSVTDMSSMFSGCIQLSTLDLSDWKTPNVTDMSNMFGGCNQLTSVGDLSGWDTSSVTSMAGMFGYCEQLTDLSSISNWGTFHVTDMSYMFQSCEQLSSLNLSKWNTLSVTDMSYMFDGCSELTSFDLSSWNTINVVNMYEMFFDCHKLSTTITIRGNVAKYDDMFRSAATAEGASITVNYVDDATKEIAIAMVETAEGNENVKLGSKVA